jgi:release factor-specific protein-(glutamine-N5) methyltransferase
MAARTALRDAVAVLHEAGIETARNDAEWLFADALGVGRAELHVVLDDPLPATVTRALTSAVRRRARGEPLQHILGWESFRGLRLRVGREVLVPRPETEVLVEWALARLPALGQCPLRAIDVGTGSGNIACAIAAERPDVRVVAIDVSSTAAFAARENAVRLGLAGRVAVARGDLLAAVRDASADLVVSNPPYLPSAILPRLPREVREHDPRLAIDGGADGLEVIRRLIAEAPRVLRPGAALVMETGGGDHTRAVRALMVAGGFVAVDVREDLTGIARFVSGSLPRPPGSGPPSAVPVSPTLSEHSGGSPLSVVPLAPTSRPEGAR